MPRCTECTVSFTTLERLHLHYKVDHNFKDIKAFRCKESNCYRDYSSWESLKKHFIRDHFYGERSFKNCQAKSVKQSQTLFDVTNSESLGVCHQRDFTMHSSKLVVTNIDSEHHKNHSETVFDPRSLQQKFHANGDTEVKVRVNSIISQSSSYKSNLAKSSTDQGKASKVGNFDKQNFDELKPILERMNIEVRDLLLENCYELYADLGLPRKHVQKSVDSMKILVQGLLDCYVELIQKILQNLNVSQSTISQITSSLNKKIMEPFSKLDTEYKRIKIMKEFGLLVPEPYILGSETQTKYHNGQVIKEITNIVAHWVPLRKTFQVFFETPGVLEATLKYMRTLYTDRSILSNLIQAETWLEKLYKYFPGKIVIPFVIFVDAFEVNDALGSHRGISKIEGVYASIPCLPPEFRSAIQNIFLVLLYYASDRKKCTNEDIFMRLIEEINYLEETGLQFNVNGKSYTIYFSLAQLIGDHLGLNALLDMVECFYNCFFCRSCITHPLNAQTDLRERKTDLRRVEDYSKHVELGVKKTGLKCVSVWNKVKSHHAYLNSYSDILHDIPEGFLDYGIPEVLHHFIFKAKKKVHLDILNDRLNTFNYTVNGLTNKPPSITLKEVKKKTVSFSASEQLTFTLILSMLIGDLIDPEDEVWQYYLSLRRIVDITYAKQLQVETSDLLDTEVAEHHEMYQRLFDEKLKAKHHAGTHLGRNIRKIGPPANLSTDRFESKNRSFKVSAESTTSRKQPTYTLGFKNQLNFFHRMHKNQGFVVKFETGPKCSINEWLIRDISRRGGPLLESSNLNETSWANINGIKYNIGGCITTSISGEELPSFGVIRHIIVNDGNHRASLCCEALLTNGFDENLHAFRVSSSNEIILIEDIQKLESVFPVIIHCMPDGETYVTLKRSL